MLFKKISRKWGEKPHFRLIFGTSVHNRLTNDSLAYSFRAFFACDTSEKRNLKGNRS